MENYKQMWKIEQKDDSSDALKMYIYGDVEGDGYDWWYDQTIESETSANHFRNELDKYKNVSEIEIFINSRGGSVFEGTAIYNQLRRHPAHKTVYIDGFACSIASVIAMAGDKIVMPRNAMMMVHHASMYCYGNSAELRKAAEDLDQINRGNRQAYLQKAGDKLTEEKLIELLDNESYLTADDCISYGLADAYAEKDADMVKMKELLDDMVQKQTKSIEQRIMLKQSMLNQLKALDKETKKAYEPDQKNNLIQLFEKLGGKQNEE